MNKLIFKPGMLVLTVKCKIPENNGHVLQLIEFIGKIDNWKGNDRWSFKGVPLIGTYGHTTNTIRENAIIPIIDPDLEKEIQSEEKKHDV